MSGHCEATNRDGHPCQAPPIVGNAYCFWHSPDHQEEARAARELGGRRRRRESALAGAFDIEDMSSVEGLQRVVEIIATDVLGQENSLHRAEVLIALVNVGVRLRSQIRTEERVADLERAMQMRKAARR